jgi:hypothetical protein
VTIRHRPQLSSKLAVILAVKVDDSKMLSAGASTLFLSPRGWEAQVLLDVSPCELMHGRYHRSNLRRDLAFVAVKVDSDLNHAQGLLAVGCVITCEKSLSP